MRLLKEKDLFELRVLSVITNEDLRVLHLLYQPFIGNLAVSIYQIFLYTSALTEDGPSSHEFLFKQLNVTSLEFANAIVKLEACELLKTYVEKNNEYNYYFYEIYSPKQSKSFFKDPIFAGLLVSSIGEKRVQQLAQLFASGKKFNLKNQEITTSFGEVYNPDLNGKAFNSFVAPDHLGRNEIKRTSPFNQELFFEYLRKNHLIIPELALNSNDLKQIISLTMIYAFNEETMAAQIGTCFDATKPLGSKVDFEFLARNLKELARYEHIAKPKKLRRILTIDSSSDLAKLVNRMELESSYDFLSSFNDGGAVADSEVKLLTRLSRDFNLTNGVINAIVYHVLSNYEMKLPTALVEKIAGSISRLKFEHAIDVVNYFESQKENRKPNSQGKAPVSTATKNSEDQVSDDAYAKLLEELKNVKN